LLLAMRVPHSCASVSARMNGMDFLRLNLENKYAPPLRNTAAMHASTSHVDRQAEVPGVDQRAAQPIDLHTPADSSLVMIPHRQRKVGQRKQRADRKKIGITRKFITS